MSDNAIKICVEKYQEQCSETPSNYFLKVFSMIKHLKSVYNAFEGWKPNDFLKKDLIDSFMHERLCFYSNRDKVEQDEKDMSDHPVIRSLFCI